MRLKVLFSFFFLWVYIVQAQNSLIESQDSERLFKSSMELLGKEKYSAARKSFEEYLTAARLSGQQQDIRLADAEYYIAYCALNLFNPDAELLFKEFIADYPWHSKATLAYFELGNFFYNNRQYQKTIDYLRKVNEPVLSEEQKMEASFKLGYAYFSQKEFDAAFEYFNKIKHKNHKYTYAASYYAGYIELKNGLYEEALADLLKAEQNEGYSSVVPYLIANVYYQQGENEKLIEYAEKSVARPDIKEKAELYMLMAEAHFMKADYAKAGEFFENYEKENEGALTPPLQYRLAFSQYQNGKYEQAVTNFKPIATQEDALGQVAGYYLGLSYLKLEEKQFALLAFQQAAKSEYSKQIQEEALFNYAKVSAELGNFGETINTLKNFNRNYPGSIHAQEADELLGEAFLKTSNYTEAINYIESLKNRSLRLNTAYQRVTFFKGTEEFNNNNFVRAVEMFNKSSQFAIDKEVFIAVCFWRGESYSILKEYDQAVNSYAKVFQNTNAANEFYMKSRYGIAYAYYSLQKYDKALEHFREYVVNLEKKSNRLYYDDAILRLADLYAHNKNYPEALKYYNKAIDSRNPDLDYAYYKKGVILPFQDKDEEAVANFDKVIYSFPSSLYVDDALYGKAEIVFTHGNFNDAIAIFSKLIATYPTSVHVPYALNFRAISFRNQGNYEKAIDDYKRIIYDYPNHAIAVEALAGMQDALSRSDRSEEFEYFREAFVKSNPEGTSLVNIDYEAARSFYNNQKYDRAAQALKDYIDKYPDSPNNPDARYFLADSYLKSGKTELAAVQFRKVVEEHKSDYYTRAILKLADLYNREDKHSEARDWYLQLLNNSANPKERAIAWASLMDVYYSLKKYDSVKYYAEQVLNHSKFSLDANRATLYLGKVAYMAGDKEAAIDHFISTINLAKDVNAAEAKYMIGLILYEQQKYKQSLETLYELNNSFYTYSNWLSKSFLLIADNFIATDELFQAKATLQSIIEKSTHKPSIEEAKMKLDQIQQLEKKEADSNE